MKEFRAIVIGAGQGGSPLAHQLADRDWTVALIERETLSEGFFALMDSVT